LLPANLIAAFFCPASAWGYRPFVSTDAAVADLREMEIEFGYFNFARERSRNTFTVPKVVLNYGLIQNLELVGEFSVEVPPRGSVQLVDSAMSLKSVLKEGVLQEKSGVSFAVEAGPLLPSTSKEEKQVWLRSDRHRERESRRTDLSPKSRWWFGSGADPCLYNLGRNRGTACRGEIKIGRGSEWRERQKKYSR
jgi:hypothetical protein